MTGERLADLLPVEGDGLTVREFAEKAGMSLPNAVMWLQNAKDRGDVVQRGDHFYQKFI